MNGQENKCFKSKTFKGSFINQYQRKPNLMADNNN